MTNLQPNYSLQDRQDKIAAKRKQTPWRDFLMEIASWIPLVLHKHHGFISRYPTTNRINNIKKTLEYESERESLVDSGLVYDDTIGFLDQLQILISLSPFPALTVYGPTENCDYADSSHSTKNAYLSFNTVDNNENIIYSSCVKDNCSNVFNSVMVWDSSQNIYSSSEIIKSYNVFFSKFIVDCNNIWLSTNLMGCSECILCDNLTNKSYYINNIAYTKEQYFKQKDIIIADKSGFLSNHKKLNVLGNNYSSDKSDGSFVVYSDNVHQSVCAYQVKNGRNLFITGSVKGNENMYDVCIGGSGSSSNFYGACFSGHADNLYITECIGMSSNVYYSRHIQDCSFCLGCIGLKNKSYCIFNKQYTKEERYEKVDKIFSQMDEDGTLGQFFPASMNPFYFNDTAAYLIDPSFTKEEVTAKGYLRRDEPIKVDIPADAKVVKSTELDQFEKFDEQGNWTINADILKYVIQDELGNYYRIIPMEYKFLVKHALPLPRKHWLERMKENFKIN